MRDNHSHNSHVGATAQPKAWLERWRARLRNFRRKKQAEDSIRDVIEDLIGEGTAEAATINIDERLLLQNTLRLRDVTAYDVMVPRADMVAVDVATSLPDLIQIMSREAHSRLPVIRETLDDVIGIVHIKDMLVYFAKPDDYDLAKIMRKALFVSPRMRVLDLLIEMRLARLHMAMVVDEYGGIDGLVTIEDLIESIVGDIQDEHDVDAPPGIVDGPDGVMLADARAEVAAFEKTVGAMLTAEERALDIDTLGGLVVYLAGRMPSRGKIVVHSSGFEFEVIDGDVRRVHRLLIRHPSRNLTVALSPISKPVG